MGDERELDVVDLVIDPIYRALMAAEPLDRELYKWPGKIIAVDGPVDDVLIFKEEK